MDKSEEPVQYPLYDPFLRVSMDKSEKNVQYPLYDPFLRVSMDESEKLCIRFFHDFSHDICNFFREDKKYKILLEL